MRRCLTVALLASLAAGELPIYAQEKSAAAPDAKEEPAVEAPNPAKPHPDEPALRDAIKSLAKALQEGDRDGIRQAMYAANPTERKMLDAMAEMAAQLAQLHKASAKAFGIEEAKLLTGDVGMEMGRIDAAEVSIDGDAATVRYKDPAVPAPADPAAPAAATAPPADGDADPPPPAPPMVLKKVDGRWRVPVAELSKDTTPEEIDQRLTDLEAQTKIIGELAGEITQGKYKSAEKAAEAWQGKMMQALTPKKPEVEKGRTEEGEKKAAEAEPD